MSSIIFYPPPTSQVRMYSPQFMLTISSVDNLESKLNQAQNDLGIPHYNRVPITYRPKTDTGYVYHNECPHSLCQYIRDWFLCVCSDKTTILLSLSLSLPPPLPPTPLRFWSMMALVSLVALRFLYVSYSQRRGGPRKTPSSDGFKFTAINPFVSTAMYMYYMYIINYINFVCPSVHYGNDLTLSHLEARKKKGEG